MQIATQAIHAVARNTTWLMGGHVVGSLLNMGAGLLLARYLGAGDYGVYSWALSYLAFFMILTDLGIGSILVRDTAKAPSSAGTLLGNAASIRLLLSLLATALACLVVSSLDQPLSTKAVVYIASMGLSIAAFGPYGLFSVIFQARLRMEYPVAVRILTSLATLGLFLALVQRGGHLAHFVGATVLSNLLGLCAIWYLARGFVHVKLAVDAQVWRGLLRESWPLALNTLFAAVYAKAAQLMLIEMKGPEAVGLYSAALRLTEMLTPFVAAFMTSVFPVMSAHFRASESALTNTYRLSFKYVLSAIIPIAVATSLLSEPIVLLTYGSQFLASARALAILVWAEVFVFYGFVHYFLLISVGKQRTFLAFTGLAAVSNVVLNVLLIPPYGVLGASVAAVLANMLGAGIIVGHLLPSTRAYNMVASRCVVRPLLASLVMGLYMYGTRSNLLLALAGALPVFTIAMLCVGGFGSEDFRLVQAVLRRG